MVTMDVFAIESYVHGHHFYMQEWTLFIGEKLECQGEEANEKDSNAAVIMKRTVGPGHRTKVVGQVPGRISTACSLFLLQSGNLKCKITGARCYSSNLPQGKLEVPCTLLLVGSSLRNSYLNNATSLAMCYHIKTNKLTVHYQKTSH